MKTTLTDELIANIAARHGRCGEDWYITSDEGVLYLHIKDKDKGLFLHPILICEPIMLHLGYLLPSSPMPKDEPSSGTPISFEDMKEQINAYFNTCEGKERKRMLSLCHYPTTVVNELHFEDAIKLYNIIKTKLYGKH